MQSCSVPISRRQAVHRHELILSVTCMPVDFVLSTLDLEQTPMAPYMHAAHCLEASDPFILDKVDIAVKVGAPRLPSWRWERSTW